MMPFVQRNSRGKITGIFASNQPHMDVEFLPDDHPEVVKFMENLPPPPPPLSERDMERVIAESKRFEAELKIMNDAFLRHMHLWSELEMSLGGLLYQLLNVRPASSNLARAIYYSAPHFAVRRGIVSDTIVQFALENPKLKGLDTHWAIIDRQIEKAQNDRNVLAHGSPLNLPGNKRRELRFTSPAFDIKRVQNKLSAGKVPGLSAQDIVAAVERLVRLQSNIDRVNRAIEAFRARKPKIVKKELSAIK